MRWLQLACKATIDFAELNEQLSLKEINYCRLDVYVK